MYSDRKRAHARSVCTREGPGDEARYHTNTARPVSEYRMTPPSSDSPVIQY